MFFPLHDNNNEAVKAVPVVSYLIIGLCFLVQIYTIVLAIGDPAENPVLATHFAYRHGLVPSVFFSGNTSYQIGPLDMQLSDRQLETLKSAAEGSKERQIAEFREVQSNRLWIWLMPLTCIFLHAGWMHILSNVWFFWIFSDNVEEKFGSFFFLVFYIVTGVASSLFHAVLRMDATVPLVGASGAVSAVMGAYVAFFPKNRITSYFCPVWFFIRRIDVPAVLILGLYLLTNLISMSQASLTGANVAFDAHIGGFIAGFAVAWLMKKSGKN